MSVPIKADDRPWDTDLRRAHCTPCEGGLPPLGPDEIALRLGDLDGWQFSGGEIARTYRFANYHEVIAFVNAVAWISHRENHHPILEVSFRECIVRYSTHAIGGLSLNDFICAAHVNALLDS